MTTTTTLTFTSVGELNKTAAMYRHAGMVVNVHTKDGVYTMTIKDGGVPVRTPQRHTCKDDPNVVFYTHLYLAEQDAATLRAQGVACSLFKSKKAGVWVLKSL